MNDSSLFSPSSTDGMESPSDATGIPRPEDSPVERDHDHGDTTTPMGNHLHSKTPSKVKGNKTPFFHPTSKTDSPDYTDTSDKFDAQGNKENRDDDDGDAEDDSDASSDSASIAAEFDSVVREAALQINRKLESNKEWADKLLREFTAFSKTNVKVYSEYSRILHLAQQESERLDGVEPDIHGTANRLSLEHPGFGGGNLVGTMANQLLQGAGALLGGKRKVDQA